MKLKKIYFTVLIALCLFCAGSKVFAGKNPNGEIISDPNAVNGGVNLSPSSTEKVSTPKPEQVILSIPFQTQKNYYYGAPASASMIVTALGYPKTQDEMAKLLGTTKEGTDAGDGVAAALNKAVRGSKYVFRWSWQGYHDVEKMKKHIVEALSYGNPVLVNTTEGPGDCYLIGHNVGYTFNHFGIIGDYFDPILYKAYFENPIPENMPVLEDLYNLLQKQEETVGKKLAVEMEIYVKGSLNVFNHRTSVDTNNRVVCYDIKELGKQLKKIGMLIIQDQVWNRVTINRASKKTTRYFVDEFHLLLKESQTANYSSISLYPLRRPSQRPRSPRYARAAGAAIGSESAS